MSIEQLCRECWWGDKGCEFETIIDILVKEAALNPDERDPNYAEQLAAAESKGCPRIGGNEPQMTDPIK